MENQVEQAQPAAETQEAIQHVEQQAEQTRTFTPIEERAIGMGWIPPEDFKGDPTKHKSAEEWVKGAETKLPLAQAQLQKFEADIYALKNQLRQQSDVQKKVLETSQRINEQAYERAKAELISQQEQAVAEGNVEAFRQLKAREEKLQPPQQVQIEPSPQASATMQAWQAKNAWYMNDPEMTKAADEIGHSFEGSKMPFADVLDFVETKIKSRFPHKFQNQARATATAVNTGDVRAPAGTTGKKTYHHLPSQAKAICDEMVRKKMIPNAQYYVDNFPWD